MFELSTNLDRCFQYLDLNAGGFIEAIGFHVGHFACVSIDTPRVFAVGVLGLELIFIRGVPRIAF